MKIPKKAAFTATDCLLLSRKRDKCRFRVQTMAREADPEERRRALNAFRFIGLTIVAVLLGVLSAAVTFGGGQALFSGPFSAHSSLLESVAESGISKGETANGLRHIVERQ